MIPAFELAIEPIGHGQEFIERPIRHAPSQLRGNEVPDEHTVKGVTAKGDPSRTEDLVGSRRAGIWQERNPQQRQITRTPTTVRDEHYLFTAQFAPIGIGGGHRFKLKRDLVKATGVERRTQALQRQRFIF